MYGLLNTVLIRKLGEPAWERIKLRANVYVDVSLSMEACPDELTYQLVGPARDESGLATAPLLDMFGAVNRDVRKDVGADRDEFTVASD